MEPSVKADRPETAQPSSNQAVRFLLIGFFLVALVELIAILILNGGSFTYSLDDPYIHLSVAESIARGTYGINSGSYSAPASSILWPYLLVPFVALSLGEFLPLLINFLAAAVTVGLIFGIVQRSLRLESDEDRNRVILLISATLILLTNQVGLIFTGMEHSLQVMLSLAIATGLISRGEDQPPPWWLWWALVLGPMIRYEVLALSVPALVLLAYRRQFLGVVISAICLGAGLLLFSIFLQSHDLGWLPSSVLLKSDLTGSTDWLMVIMENLKRSLHINRVAFLGGCLVLSLIAGFKSKGLGAKRPLALWLSGSIALHMLAGRYGWFGRYEIYIWTVAVVMLIHLYREPLGRFLTKLSVGRVSVMLIILISLAYDPFVRPTLLTPLGANNVYEQHYQLHRFITEQYQAPVAVNDIGWTSYKNDKFVLDLWGLASAEARELRLSGSDPEWMNSLAQKHDVRLAIIYDQWFEKLPENWQLLGQLQLGRSRVTAGSPTVSFYALDQETYDRTKPMLQKFQATLPPGVVFK